MNYTIIFDIENKKEHYVKCSQIIEQVLKNAYILNDDLKFTIVERTNKNMPFNKLEEPLEGEDLSSSFSVVEKTAYDDIIAKNNKSLKFHIRIAFSEAIDMENLHYLAMLISNFNYLIDKKRLSIFLVPRTSNEYPFEKNGEVDTELFNVMSKHLRALIGNKNKGIIFGVPKKRLDNSNIVKALDFKNSTKVIDSFPIITIDGNIEYDKELEKTYINTTKVGNDKEREIDLNSKNINNYSLLFKSGLAYFYLNHAKQMNKKQRFGFSTHEQPNIALCDYVFETAYNMLLEKSLSAGLSLEKLEKHLHSILLNANIISFSIFSFITDFSNISQNNENILQTALNSSFTLSCKISSGLEQIIQNSIQHSSRKISVLSFFKKNNDLRIIISDLSQESIIATFKRNLKSESNFIDNNLEESSLFDTLSKNKQYYKRTRSDSTDYLNLNCFFNDFKNTASKDGTLEKWFEFRQSDSSAHIGMSLFANTIKRCDGYFSMISDNRYIFEADNKNTYDSRTMEKIENIYHFPGTEYIVTLPMTTQPINYSTNFAQFNSTNYIENYESFAEFIDYDVSLLDYKVDRAYLNKTFKKVESLEIEKAIDKFSMQMLWTNYWLTIFEQIKLEENKIYCIDYQMVEIKNNYVENNYAKETIIKGFIDSLGIFASKYNSKKINIALVNVSKAFINLFKDISLTLSLKAFPSNVQIFLSDSSEENQIHLLGNNYGLAIQNAYLLSLESYYESYDGSIYYDVDNIIKPFNDLINPKAIKVVPFLGVLASKNTEKSMFFSKVSKIAEKDIINENGYKFTDNHTRLGNKVHIHSFYEMSHLFHRTVMANHVAFAIIRDLKNKNSINILNDNILFYGYASYSQAILMSLTKILESYRILHNIKVNDGNISYSIYQYNLQYESNPGDIKIYLRNAASLEKLSNIQVVQIVPISSTLTTFAKMWKKFEKDFNPKQSFKLNENYTVFWVRDIEQDCKLSASKVSDLERKYFDIDENDIVTSKFSALDNKKTVNWILVGRVKWEKPETCEKCFPKENMLNEIPIIETDPTSTVPAQQIYSKLDSKTNKQIALKKMPYEDIKKYEELYGKVHYGHFKRGKNHYQFFIDTQEYFASVSSLVKDWLENLRNKETEEKTPWPTIDIIFSPSHNTNVGFSQYVNAYYFNGAAEIISINEDKEFNSNFSCEYAMLKNTIQRLVDDFNLSYNFKDGQAVSKLNYRPVRFIFVDDNIITGDSFRKASKLLQSLLPNEIINNYGTNVFEKCFVLIDRMSSASKNTYILPKENFYAFCKINISSMRKHGDSCVCCKLKNQAHRLYNRSSTQYSSNYWKSKINKLEEKPFETLNNEICDETSSKKAYLRMIFSHLIKDYIKTDINDNETIFVRILQLMNYFSGNTIEDFTSRESFEFFESYMPIFKNKFNKTDDSFNEEAVKTILKIISRPFFTYNQTIKQEVLRFLIILCETILLDEPEFNEKNNTINIAVLISKKIKGLFSSSNKLIEFVKEVVMDALTDLHSTYLLRYETMKKILIFINKTQNKENLDFCEIKKFFLHYSICVQRLVDEGNDETRSLRLEYFLITCNDDFSDTYIFKEEERKTFYEKFLDKLKDCSLCDDVKKAFKVFCDEIFLGNGRILYDGIEKICADKSFNGEPQGLYDNYFMERWSKFRALDSSWVNLCYKNEDNGENEEQVTIEKQMELFNLLHGKSTQSNNTDNDVVENRYRTLLTCISDMIAEKYHINPNCMRLALLTCSKEMIKKPKDINIKDFVIESCVEHKDGKPIVRKQDFDSNAKYIIKKRILSFLDDDNLKELGYHIVNENPKMEKCTINCKIGWNDAFEDIEKTNHRKPYFILKFQNKIVDDNNPQECANTIVPVYLYFSFLIDEVSELHREIIPQLIIRDILTYRKRIINYLEKDFTTDVMERYSISTDQEAILKNEKVMSHTPMDQDKKELDYFLFVNENNSNSNFDYSEKIKTWTIVRSFCNTMIARLYNRVFRNIDRTFEKVVDEYTNMNRETYKLYVPALSNGGDDGKNFPLNKISQIVPCNYGKSEGVYNLFEDIITFEVDDSIKNVSAYEYIFKGEKYAYNLDYVKNIIYRICFDALRFSYGAGAEKDDFIARILHHYENKNNEENWGDNKDNKWLNTEKYPICYVSFSTEKSESKNFDWLVIKNELYKSYENNIGYIKKKMEDSLDFTDGHMSLVTAKEFFAKMLVEDDAKYLEDMYNYEVSNGKSYFVTKLPIIAKGEINHEENRSYLDR